MFSDVDIKWSQMQQQLTGRKKNCPIMILLFLCFLKKNIHKLKIAK